MNRHALRRTVVVLCTALVATIAVPGVTSAVRHVAEERPDDAGDGRSDARREPEWRATEVVVETSADVQTFDVTVDAANGEYYAVGRSNAVEGSWSVWFDGEVQRVAILGPGEREVDAVSVHENPDHVAIDAWKVARRRNASVVQLGVDTRATVAIDRPLPAHVARAAIDRRPGRSAPEVPAGARDSRNLDVGDVLMTGLSLFAGIAVPGHGSGYDSSVVFHRTIYYDLCTRNFNNFRYSDHRAYAYSRIVNFHYNCYWTDMSLWEGGTGGQNGSNCYAVYGVAFGRISTSASSGTGWPGHPDKGQICSNSAAWSRGWVLTVSWDGNMNWV